MKKQINNAPPHSAFLACFGPEWNYLHLRAITEFLQERAGGGSRNEPAEPDPGAPGARLRCVCSAVPLSL